MNKKKNKVMILRYDDNRVFLRYKYIKFFNILFPYKDLKINIL